MSGREVPVVLIGGFEEGADFHSGVGLVVDWAGSAFGDWSGLADVKGDTAAVAFDGGDAVKEKDYSHVRSGL